MGLIEALRLIDVSRHLFIHFPPGAIRAGLISLSIESLNPEITTLMSKKTDNTHMNKQIRTLPGGSELLDVLEYVHRQRLSSHPIRNPKGMLEEIEDRIQQVRDKMREQVIANNQASRHKDEPKS